jgi:hypothetical protein
MDIAIFEFFCCCVDCVWHIAIQVVWVLELDVSNLIFVYEGVYMCTWLLNYIWGHDLSKLGFNSPIWYFSLINELSFLLTFSWDVDAQIFIIENLMIQVAN